MSLVPHNSLCPTQSLDKICWGIFLIETVCGYISSKLDDGCCYTFLKTVISISAVLIYIYDYKQFLFHSLRIFHTRLSWWSFTRAWGIAKSPQFSRNFLSILADLKNVVVWMVSILSLISSSSKLFFSRLWRPLEAYQLQLSSASRSCSTAFLFSGKVLAFAYIFTSFIFILWSTGMRKSTRGQVRFFLSINCRSGLLNGIGGSVEISKSQSISFVSFSWTNSGLCRYYMVQ